MAELAFQTLSFGLKDKFLAVHLLQAFSTKIPLAELEKIAPFSLKDKNTPQFEKISQEKAEIKFSFLLAKYLDDLTTKLTGNKAKYIHKNSGIPLIGNVAFGIVYRESSIIEIKPVTSCNLDCVYCSISEGLSSKKNDFVVEKDYLIEELQKLLDFVGEPVEVHIGVQGEPFMYAQMEELFADLEAMKEVHTISIDTNGTLLNKEKIDCFSKFTKLQLNLSLDAIDEVLAKKVAGTRSYNIDYVKNIIAYAAEKMPRTPIVAPVLTQGWNESEMEKIILWIKSLKKQPILGIQNFLRYKTGRSSAKTQEISWEDFYQRIEAWEKKHDIKLKLSKEDFHIKETRPLPKPFVVGDVVKAELVCVDRFPGASLAVAKGRTISVPQCEFKEGKKIKVKIVRDKHNVFVGQRISV